MIWQTLWCPPRMLWTSENGLIRFVWGQTIKKNIKISLWVLMMMMIRICESYVPSYVGGTLARKTSNRNDDECDQKTRPKFYGVDIRLVYLPRYGSQWLTSFQISHQALFCYWGWCRKWDCGGWLNHFKKYDKCDDDTMDLNGWWSLKFQLSF